LQESGRWQPVALEVLVHTAMRRQQIPQISARRDMCVLAGDVPYDRIIATQLSDLWRSGNV
jgi:hypothetical protein